jgi:hypothetical protein
MKQGYLGRLTATIALLFLAAMIAPVSAQKHTKRESFRANAMGQVTFVMPSLNVECTYTPKGGTLVYQPFDGGPELSCDRREPTYLRFVLTPKSVRQFDNVGDQSCCGVDNVLAYGARWSEGPFICDSRESGLTCKRGDGRGFVIGRRHSRRL